MGNQEAWRSPLSGTRAQKMAFHVDVGIELSVLRFCSRLDYDGVLIGMARLGYPGVLVVLSKDVRVETSGAENSHFPEHQVSAVELPHTGDGDGNPEANPIAPTADSPCEPERAAEADRVIEPVAASQHTEPQRIRTRITSRNHRIGNPCSSILWCPTIVHVPGIQTPLPDIPCHVQRPHPRCPVLVLANWCRVSHFTHPAATGTVVCLCRCRCSLPPGERPAVRPSSRILPLCLCW